MQPKQGKWIDRRTVQKGTCSVLIDPPPSAELHTDGKNKNLSNQVLTGLDLSHGDFTNANFSNANFNGVKSMFKARIDGADLDGSTLIPKPYAYVLTADWGKNMKINQVRSLWWNNDEKAKVFVPSGLELFLCEPIHNSKEPNKNVDYLEENAFRTSSGLKWSSVPCICYYRDSFGGTAKGTTKLRLWAG